MISRAARDNSLGSVLAVRRCCQPSAYHRPDSLHLRTASPYPASVRDRATHWLLCTASVPNSLSRPIELRNMWRSYASAARLSRRTYGSFEVTQALGRREREPRTQAIQWLAAAACVLLAGSESAKDQRTHADKASSLASPAGGNNGGELWLWKQQWWLVLAVKAAAVVRDGLLYGDCRCGGIGMETQSERVVWYVPKT